MGVGEFGSGYSCALEIDENRMLLAFMGIFTFLVRLSVMLHRRSIMLIIHRSTHTPNTPHQPWHLIASQDAPSLVREILPNTMALAKLKYNSCIPIIRQPNLREARLSVGDEPSRIHHYRHDAISMVVLQVWKGA